MIDHLDLTLYSVWRDQIICLTDGVGLANAEQSSYIVAFLKDPRYNPSPLVHYC